MTTRLILVAALCVLTLALAACDGGGDGITVARADTEQPMQPETPPEPAGPEAESKTWTCYASSDFRKKTPLISLASGALVKNFAWGGVTIFGVFKLATVLSEGLDLRWDFSDLDGVAFFEAVDDGVLSKHLQYAFVLKPDGTGLYYDFSMSDDGRAKPSQIFQCLRSSSTRPG